MHYDSLNFDEVLQPFCDVDVFTVVDRVGHVSKCMYYNSLNFDEVLQPFCDVDVFTVVDRVRHVGQCHLLLVCLLNLKVLLTDRIKEILMNNVGIIP